ncbi:MAG: flagellar biosynthesis protein FlhB [Spirochaetaceae bacterium]|nr:flagellar biosynthesis protein FlhB [Spirochaetaceae bacterium]
MDLQWFAAEDEGRTEEPSEHKIRKAREEEGRVAKSQELIGALGLLLPGLTIFALAPRMLRVCVEMVQFYLYRAVELDPVRDGTIAVAALQYYVRLALPVALVAVIAALFSNFVQVGLLFTLKPLTPNFSKIVPRFGRYFQRIFSAEGLFNFFKSLVKMVIIGAVAFFLIRSKFDVLANLQTASLWTGLTTVANIAIRMIIISALLLLLLSIPDYMFQRWQYRESLKMSVEEVKRERKELDGDPLIKSRLRRRMQEIMTRDMLRRVPEADVVITNPTHLAIALEYHRENMAAPQVTAKGEDQTAAMIRRIAEQNGVPVMENKPLARALYQETRVGDIVPVAYWEVVARILSRVMDVNEKRRKERQDKE